MAVAAQNDSIIIWDDNDPPSSPFISVLNDNSRVASNVARPVSAMGPHMDTIFGETQHDKENSRPGTSSSMTTPFKTPMPNFELGSTARKTGRGQMLPPSTRASSPGTASTLRQTLHSLPDADRTPSRARSSRANTADGAILEETGIDDTCFSTFSAVPDMTLFARLGRTSPTKTSLAGTTPRAAARKRLSSSRSPSPTPRRLESQNETTSLLIDFTQQIDAFAAPQRSPARGHTLSPSRTENNLLSHLTSARSPPKRPARGSLAQSPSKSSLLNLLDFELPPPPTPRSAPQFTAREVESLKSGFQSQLSSIKAKLSGKEAEVEALKKALEDAERRVGEAQERERTERAKREDAERERDSWERRGTEVEKVLSNVREEVLSAEAEREALERRAVNAEDRAQDLDARHADLLSKVAAGNEVSGDKGEEVARLVAMQLDARIEGVSRELHTVYKKKHESKVATLKKSYEARSEKKCADLQAKVDELSRANEKLRTARDETFTGEGLDIGGPGRQRGTEEQRAELDRCRAEVEEFNARAVGLEGELTSFRADFARLQEELEGERVEKGELVAAVDEMLALQTSGEVAPAVVEDFRRSLARPATIRAPVPFAKAKEEQQQSVSAGESKLARPSGLARFGAGKSKMMSNIERMGRARE